MELGYDFHLHSCLSPCGDSDMTPHNLVNMAKLLDLDIIALTDHNTIGNCRSAMEVGREIGLPVVPGMELCTAEEIHVVCLFPDLECAQGFDAAVRAALPPIRNKPEIYGEQLLMDSRDGVTGREDTLLVTASALGIDEVPGLCREHGGFAYPAHINRASFSILASLGDITPDMGFSCAEISLSGDVDALTAAHPALKNMKIMRSSDAHYLEDMTEAMDTIHLPQCTPQALLDHLRAL